MNEIKLILVPLKLELKSVLDEAVRCYPEYKTVVQLSKYQQIMEKTMTNATCENIRKWAETRFFVAATLISLYTVRNN